MSKLPVKERRLQKRSAVRTGRPPKERAGEVDERILDAARRVFLERGLAGASMEEIAGLACAGKPTIYARFARRRRSSPPSSCATLRRPSATLKAMPRPGQAWKSG